MADDHDCVRAQLAIGGLDQVNATVFDGNGNVFRFPAIAPGSHILPPCGHKLLRVENGNLREDLGAALRLLFGFAALLPYRLPIFCCELRAEEIANPCEDAVLPIVEPLQPSEFVRRPRRASAKLVRIAKLGEELDRIVDAIDAKLQSLDILRPHINRNFLSGRVSAAGVEREETSLLFLREQD